MKLAIIIISTTILFSLGYADFQIPANKVIPVQFNNLKNPVESNPKNIASGAKIYKKLCWTCHGDNGNGKGPGAAELSNKPADLNQKIIKERTDGALFWWINEGGNDMQPFKDVLSKQEIWQSVIYIRKIQSN